MKTIEQKAEEYAEVAFAKALKAPWPEAKQGFADAFIAGAKEALSSQWVNVDDEMPEPRHDVVVAYTDEWTNYFPCLAIGDYDNTEGKWYSNDDEVYRNRHIISHWLSIPEPPKTKEK